VLLASKLAHTIKYSQMFYTVVQYTGCLSVRLSICLSQPMTILKQLRQSTRIWSTNRRNQGTVDKCDPHLHQL